jgi:hypothetical protein
MAAGKVVFDGTPEQLTDLEAQRLYGLETDPRGVAGVPGAVLPVDDSILRGVPAVA